MSSFSKNASSSSSTCEDDSGELRRGPWTLHEDSLLLHYISLHGEGRWNLLSKRAGLRRTGKSCRLRWLNYLKPDVKRGNLSPQEQFLILDLHSKWGNRWSKIAQHLPGRTDNEIKNYWRTRVQKQARHLKVDANSTAFQEIIRYFWMPRLLQKIQGSTVSPQPPPPPPPPLQEVGYDPFSDSDNGSNSAELCRFQQFQTISPNFHAMDGHTHNSTNYNSYVKDCYYVDSMETMSAVPQGLGDQIGIRHEAESDWAGRVLEDNMWKMDEFMTI